MVAIEFLVISAALFGANDDVVLLQFTASGCGNCQAMAPTVDRLSRSGYPVRNIDIDDRAELARRHRISSVPTVVMMSNGREAGRLVGPSSYDRLKRMFHEVGFRPSGDVVRGQSPERPGLISSAIRSISTFGSGEKQAVETSQRLSPRRLAQQATVRLRIEDERGFSHGTGTIIDVHGQEALVLTCGHIFRDSGGKGKIQITLYPAVGEPRVVPGQLIDYEADARDIGLVSMRPGVELTAAPVAADMSAVRKGAKAFTFGCDHGRDPTKKETSFKSINRFIGEPNIEAGGEPAVGRSGGGLFNDDGQLVGVCKFANATDDEGIYSSLPSIHSHLDRIGQSRIYQTQRQDGQVPAKLQGGGEVQAELANAPRPRFPATPPLVGDRNHKSRSSSREGESRLGEPTTRPQPSATFPTRTSGELPTRVSPIRGVAANPANPAMNRSASGELICIIRQPGDPNGQVIVLQQPSAELLARIARESQSQVADPRSQATAPTTASLSGRSVVRAQSTDRR